MRKRERAGKTEGAGDHTFLDFVRKFYCVFLHRFVSDSQAISMETAYISFRKRALGEHSTYFYLAFTFQDAVEDGVYVG